MKRVSARWAFGVGGVGSDCFAHAAIDRILRPANHQPLTHAGDTVRRSVGTHGASLAAPPEPPSPPAVRPSPRRLSPLTLSPAGPLLVVFRGGGSLRRPSACDRPPACPLWLSEHRIVYLNGGLYSCLECITSVVSGVQGCGHW